MLKPISAIFLFLLVLMACPLHAENPLDNETDEDLEDIIDERESKVLFYLPLDGDSVARTPKFKIRSVARDYDEELPVEYGEGLVGQAAMCYGWRHFLYPADVILNRKKGSLFFWFKWNTQVKETPSDAAFVNGAISLPDSGILNSQDGKWHNFVITWNSEKKEEVHLSQWEAAGRSGNVHPNQDGVDKTGLEMSWTARRGIRLRYAPRGGSH